MILERLEGLPVGSFQYKLLLVTGLGWLFDSMDTGLIAFVLPVLTKDWGLSPAQAGWIGSIGLIGMALGAVLAGTVADRIGRKKVFTITVLLYKPVVQGLRHAHLLPPSKTPGRMPVKRRLAVWLAALAVLAVCIVLVLVLHGTI